MLQYAVLDESNAFTGKLQLYRGDERVGAVPHLAICRDLRTHALMLFHCDKEWSVLGAQIWNAPCAEPVSSVDDVRQRADRYYTGLAAKWMELEV